MEKSFGPLYSAFDSTGKREIYHSKELSKLEVVKLHQDLYLEYLKVYRELKDTKKKLEEMEMSKSKTEEKSSFLDIFRPELEKIIDKRIKNNLKLSDNCAMYGGEYVSLEYGGEQLGDTVCLQNFED